MPTGTEDLERAARGLALRIPDRLAVFARLAYNYRWCWTPDGHDVFRAIDGERWFAISGNPVRQLQEVSFEALERAAADDDLIARAERVESIVNEDLGRPWRS